MDKNQVDFNIEVKPSITYRWRKSLLKDQNPGQKDEWMATLAWANVLQKLPPTIRCTPSVIDVQGIPTTKQLEQIDRLYEEYLQSMGYGMDNKYSMENFLPGGMVNAAMEPYVYEPWQEQDVAQVNYQQAYNQSRFMHGPQGGPQQYAYRRSPYQYQYPRSFQPFQPNYQNNFVPIPVQAPPPTATEVDKPEEKKEEKETKDDKKTTDGAEKKNEKNDANGQVRNQRRFNGRFQNNRFPNNRFQNNRPQGGQVQTNLAERAAREGVFKDRTDFCKYHRMFGLHSQRCENHATCGFYTFMEQKIPDTQLRPKTQEQQLMDQNKQQMQSFMVGLASTFVEQLKEIRNKDVGKQGTNTSNSQEEMITFIMEVDLRDPEYILVHLPATLVQREELFGEIRSEFDGYNTNNGNVAPFREDESSRRSIRPSMEWEEIPLAQNEEEYPDELFPPEARQGNPQLDMQYDPANVPNNIHEAFNIAIRRFREGVRRLREENERDPHMEESFSATLNRFVQQMQEQLRNEIIRRNMEQEQQAQEEIPIVPLRYVPPPPVEPVDPEWLRDATIMDLNQKEQQIKQSIAHFTSSTRGARRGRIDVAADGDEGNFIRSMRHQLRQVQNRRAILRRQSFNLESLFQEHEPRHPLTLGPMPEDDFPYIEGGEPSYDLEALFERQEPQTASEIGIDPATERPNPHPEFQHAWTTVHHNGNAYMRDYHTGLYTFLRQLQPHEVTSTSRDVNSNNNNGMSKEDELKFLDIWRRRIQVNEQRRKRLDEFHHAEEQELDYEKKLQIRRESQEYLQQQIRLHYQLNWEDELTRSGPTYDKEKMDIKALKEQRAYLTQMLYYWEQRAETAQSLHETTNRVIGNLQNDASELQQFLQNLEATQTIGSEEEDVPLQTNNNHHDDLREAEVIEHCDPQERCKEIFSTMDVTHRYVYCRPGDTRRNYASYEWPEYYTTTERGVQNPLHESTPRINDNEYLNLSKCAVEMPFVHRYLTFFASVNMTYQQWEDYKKGLQPRFAAYYAVIEDTEDDEHWHFPGFFNEDPLKEYHYGIARPVMHEGDVGHLRKRDNIFGYVNEAYCPRYFLYHMKIDEALRQYVGTERVEQEMLSVDTPDLTWSRYFILVNDEGRPSENPIVGRTSFTFSPLSPAFLYFPIERYPNQFQYEDITPYPGVGKYAFFVEMDYNEPWHFDAFFEEDPNVEHNEYTSQTVLNRKLYNVPCYPISAHEETDSDEYYDEFLTSDSWYIHDQTNGNNVNTTFIRANQIALIEERGVMTKTLQTKEKFVEADPVVKNELTQTDMIANKEEEMQTEVVHLNSLSHVAALVLPTIQIQVEDVVIDFLVDTGSSVSIVRETTQPINTNKKPILQAVNGTYVTVQGVVTLNVMLQEKSYPHEFIVANVVHNIIGYDFWAAYQMFLRPTYQGCRSLCCRYDATTSSTITSITTYRGVQGNAKHTFGKWYFSS